MSDFKSDLVKSNNVVDVIRPVICKLLGCDDLVTVEGSKDPVCKIFDLTCGIDYLYIDDNDRVLGIGNRVQWIKPPWPPYNTFSIRKDRESGKSTEFLKRKKAIENGGLYPYLTVHSYVESRTNKLLSVAVAKTTDIINYIVKYDPPVKMSEDENGKAWFYVCPWTDMVNKGYRILTCENIDGKDRDILLAQYPAKGA
jgi:hypothetical protein